MPDGPYETVAGFVLHSLGRLPQLGDTITVDGAELTVSAPDGRHISRLSVTFAWPVLPCGQCPCRCSRSLVCSDGCRDWEASRHAATSRRSRTVRHRVMIVAVVALAASAVWTIFR
ncbi:transporter associated domain-containing protein [Rhodococcus koreensis]|uniref:transporter associated domain-containing protein n=1 Tax=Rhodococcus koreensis TaxID=99653 RepID=UPI003670363A